MCDIRHNACAPGIDPHLLHGGGIDKLLALAVAAIVDDEPGDLAGRRIAYDARHSNGVVGASVAIAVGIVPQDAGVHFDNHAVALLDVCGEVVHAASVFDVRGNAVVGQQLRLPVGGSSTGL